MTDPPPLSHVLEARFEAHRDRHPDVSWVEVLERLERRPEALAALEAMERTGGEPDVVGRDPTTGEITFCDCSRESPAQRRSLCYDGPARLGRKKHPPEGSAMEQASAWGVRLLTPEEYRKLQELGPFDTRTSSWLATPPEIRRLGGALFGDHRYGTVFVYHNGADSYYAARGFRCLIRV